MALTSETVYLFIIIIIIIFYVHMFKKKVYFLEYLLRSVKAKVVQIFRYLFASAEEHVVGNERKMPPSAKIHQRLSQGLSFLTQHNSRRVVG